MAVSQNPLTNKTFHISEITIFIHHFILSGQRFCTETNHVESTQTPNNKKKRLLQTSTSTSFSTLSQS